MRRVIPLVVIAFVAALPAFGQPPRKPGGPDGFPFLRGKLPSGLLLMQKSVQQDLKLSGEQLAQLKAVREKQRKAMDELLRSGGPEGIKKIFELMQAGEKEFAKVLNAGQSKRLEQIALQMQGIRALSTPEVVKELGITQEQMEKMKTVQEENLKATLKMRSEISDPEERRKKTDALTKELQEKVLGVLTAEQKTKWKALTGAPFKGEIPFAFPGDRPPRP